MSNTPLTQDSSTHDPSAPAPSLEAQALIPLVTLESTSEVNFIASCLLDANLPYVEVALRNEYGLTAIKELSAIPGMRVGAGTVLTPEQTDAAIDAGARFLVSPGFSQAVLDRANERDVPYLPGIYTPSEIQSAMEAGLRLLKLFPASIAGGASYLKALSDVYPGTKFMPSGGVNDENLGDYLALPNVFAVSGSWLLPRDVITSGDRVGFDSRLAHFREVYASAKGDMR